VTRMTLLFGSTQALPPLPAYSTNCLTALGLLRSAVEARGIPLAREQRKLAATFGADVVGYSRLIGRDESGTLTRLCGNAIATGSVARLT
jgi:hypothetical protein